MAEFEKDRDIGHRAAFSTGAAGPRFPAASSATPTRRTGIWTQNSLTCYSSSSAPASSKRRLMTSSSAGSSPTRAPLALVDEPNVVPEGAETEEPDEATCRALDEYTKQLRGRLTREHIYNSLLYRSVNPRAEALHQLNPRALEPLGYLGEGAPGMPFGLGVPDAFGSIFHPNQKGHEVIAAYAMQNLVYPWPEPLSSGRVCFGVLVILHGGCRLPLQPL